MYVQNENGNDKGGFGLVTIADVGRDAGYAAALGNVPRKTWIRIFRVAQVGGGLAVETVGVEGEEGGVNDERDDGVEDV